MDKQKCDGLNTTASLHNEKIKEFYMNYDELTGIISELEFNTDFLENIAANGKNDKANRYIRNAVEELRHALSDLSDADFEASTSSDAVNYGKENV